MAIPVLPLLVAGAGAAALLRETETGRRIVRSAKAAWNIASTEFQQQRPTEVVSVPKGKARANKRGKCNGAADSCDRRTSLYEAARRAATAMSLVVLYPELDRGKITSHEARKAQQKIQDLGYNKGSEVEESFAKALHELCSVHGIQCHHEWNLMAIRTQDTFLLRATCPELPSVRIISAPFALVSNEAMSRANSVITLENGENYAEEKLLLVQW